MLCFSSAQGKEIFSMSSDANFRIKMFDVGNFLHLQQDKTKANMMVLSYIFTIYSYLKIKTYSAFLNQVYHYKLFFYSIPNPNIVICN